MHILFFFSEYVGANNFEKDMINRLQKKTHNICNFVKISVKLKSSLLTKRFNKLSSIPLLKAMMTVKNFKGCLAVVHVGEYIAV